jgi:hypothetical protein
MNWQTVQEVGMFAVASGLLTWLIRSLAKHALDQDLDAFKNGLRRTHEIEIQEAKNRFVVGATSHMANVVFDKHVAFCEEYTSHAHVAMEVLFRAGPTNQILEHEAHLLGIRTRWALWLPPELEEKLDVFQMNLRTIGAYAPPRREGDPPSGDLRRSYDAFAAAMGWPEWQGERVNQEAAAQRAISELSKTLGILELTGLRAQLINLAVNERPPEASAR